MEKTVIFLTVVLLLSISIGSVGSDVGDWRGYAKIDGSIAPANTIIETYVNGVLTHSTKTEDPSYYPIVSGYYISHVVGNPGDSIMFKVNGNAVNEGSQTWSSGLHSLDLSITTATTFSLPEPINFTPF